KVGRSMGYGVPCVASPIGVEGLGLKDGEHILVGDEPNDFAEKVVKLYSDENLWNQLSANGLSFVEKNWSIEVGERRLSEFLHDVQAQLSRDDQSKKIPSRQETLHLIGISTETEYCAHVESMKDEYRRREQIESELITNDAEFWTPGYCYVCKEKTTFCTGFQYSSVRNDGKTVPNWREQLICKKCGLNNRLRASIQIFEEICQPVSTDSIYTTEQTTPLYAWLKNNYTNVIGSEYLGDSISRGAKNAANIRNEDLTRLSYKDNQFDYILSFDVLEHVADYGKALKECLRCLKPNGALLLGVPFDKNSQTNIVRARVHSNGKVEHLLPPEYHGDPVNPQGILCFYHFGWDLLDELRAIGFFPVVSYLYWSLEFGYLGGEQIIFVANKAANDQGKLSIHLNAQREFRVTNIADTSDLRQSSVVTDCANSTIKHEASRSETMHATPQKELYEVSKNPSLEAKYGSKLNLELDFFRNRTAVHDLPEIYHYWSNKYLLPKLESLGIGSIVAL